MIKLKLWKGIFWFSFIGLMMIFTNTIRDLLNNSLNLSDLLILVVFIPLFLLGFNRYYLKYFRKWKVLRKQKWFQSLLNTHGFVLAHNDAIQELIERSDVNGILKDKDKIQKFDRDVRGLIVKENL